MTDEDVDGDDNDDDDESIPFVWNIFVSHLREDEILNRISAKKKIKINCVDFDDYLVLFQH